MLGLVLPFLNYLSLEAGCGIFGVGKLILEMYGNGRDRVSSLHLSLSSIAAYQSDFLEPDFVCKINVRRWTENTLLSARRNSLPGPSASSWFSCSSASGGG